MNKPDFKETIHVGVSTCLLGENVRFDGGHKKDQFLTGILSDYFAFVPVCPEVDIGLGTPRESLRLIGDPAQPQLVTGKSGIDYTRQMLRYAKKKVAELQKMDLDGYILKKDSPSCGMERVRVYGKAGMPSRTGAGLFASHLLQGLPLLPVEEEGRLNDAALRENFIVRVFCHHRWRTQMAKRPRPKALVAFHTRHKFLIMAHSEVHMRELGRLVARGDSLGLSELVGQYGQLFFAALQRKTTRRKHTNVLMHIMGFFKKKMAADDKRELLQLIDDYRLGMLPLIVPITMIRHYVAKFEVDYITDQVYLNPHPKELMLLNHV